jgi:hypothetical protein
MHWKSDGEGELESGENHLYLVGSDGGPAVKISDWGNDYVDDLQWIDNTNIYLLEIARLMTLYHHGNKQQSLF